MNDILLAIGEALIDFMPDKKECEFDEVTAFSPKLGGAPANVCGAYAKLGGRAKLLTQLGDDPFGHKIIKELKQYNIDTSCITLTDKANTALAFVSLGKGGARTFSFYRKPSADMLYQPESVKKEYFDNAWALHFCSVSLGDFPMKEAHRAAVEYAREKGVIVSFDPNLRFNLWDSREKLKYTVREFTPAADIFKISDEELDFLTGETEIEKAFDKLFVGNVKLIIYTCGKKGAFAYTKKTSAFGAARKVEVKDTTGAGDGFIGSFLWKLNQMGIDVNGLEDLTQAQLEECLDFSNEFCTLSVMDYGAIASYPEKVTVYN